MSLWFKGVAKPNGWIRNMAPYTITCNGMFRRSSTPRIKKRNTLKKLRIFFCHKFQMGGLSLYKQL